MRLARILRDLLLCGLIFLFIGLIVVRLSEPSEHPVSGLARIVDGDTVVISGTRIRIAGMDAPELAQICRRAEKPWRCGTAARDRLQQLTDAADVSCQPRGRDTYGRSLADCKAGSRDLGAAMVRDGYAIAFGNYEREEAQARRERLGLWAGTFDPPRTWRETHGGMDEAPYLSSRSLSAIWKRIWQDGK